LSNQQITNRPRFFFGYILVSVAVVIQIIAWGLYNSYGVFFNQFLAEFSWRRETISGAFSLAQIVIGVGAIFLGTLNDRYGPRILMTIGGVVAGLGYILMSQVHGIWQLYLFHGIIVGIGLSGTDVILLSTTARWFVKRRGIMSGVVKMGTGIGIMVIPIIAARLIDSYEWRTTLIIMGIALLVLVASSAQLLRRDPDELKLFPDGEKSKPRLDLSFGNADFTLKQACCTRQFWMLCCAYFAVVFCTNTMMVHLAPYAVDLGMSDSYAATTLSIVGGVSIFGRLIMGTLLDRIGGRRALIICFIILVVSFAWLQLVKGQWALFLFTLVYGFSHGGFYAILSPMVAELFGIRSHGLLFGIVICLSSIGGALGPIVTGRIFDTTSSYKIAFLLLLVLATIALVLAVLLRQIKPKKNISVTA